jgi:hypothetical protein
MKTKSIAIMTLIPGIILSIAVTTALVAQEQQRTAVIIPQQVKAVFQEGMESRQARPDIPFQIENSLYFPAQQNIHAVIFFKAKNADLGFAPPAVTPQEAAEEEPAQTKLIAQCYVFFQFNKLENSTPGELVKEVYAPMDLEADVSSYDPEKEETYTMGYPLPPGNYLLSMAITSQDLQKIGTQYYELSLPDPFSYTDTLDTTPIFFAEEVKQVAAPETQVEIHKDFFAYSILQIKPKQELVFEQKENLDIFFFIFGTQANAEGKADIEISFEVKKGEELVIKFAPQPYDAPLVSQQLPLKTTVLVRTTKGTETTEKTERRDLEPGNYTLSIDIKDNISGKTVKKTIDFEVI